ncbi:alpha/beta fold hydrolase [Pseudonocardia kunmingensis]|uniref:Pimeloyl-ACP methyl ester carboxylesterase n=1 Tax=Pseudonocardia kunmingensis TaxID=630975 RepID=A0A543DI20_9PSEU|nr:alpha/beta hydrolase [Pseudonocardia kunmingensis]TQM08939.1 pimeloyl-ACP methyl ester carboxylesterase [Pseudonocardia kunmingensis]
MPEETTVGPVGLGARSWRGGRGRPVLVVHGLSSNARLWDGVAARLAEAGHPVVAVDLRGHGSSADVPDTDTEDLDAAPTDPTRVASEDLAAVCADLGWTAPVVAGHAWGGNVALQLAADRPGLVHGLALVDGGWLHLGDQFRDLDAAWSVLAPPRFDGVPLTAVRAGLRAGHPDWSPDAVEGALGNLRERADGSVTPRLERERHRAIIGSMLRHRPRGLYPLVRCPVLLLAATGDATPARKREQLTEAAEALAHAELVEFHGGDHDLHAHRPERVAEEIARLA